MADYFGRFDIKSQVVPMSRFQAAPRKGQLERLKRIYTYVIRTKDYAIRFRVHQPDYSYLNKILTGHTQSMVMSGK